MDKLNHTAYLIFTPQALLKIAKYNYVYSNVEWSGIAFFKLDKSNGIIDYVQVLDIYLMDVGSAFQTEFDSSNCNYFKYAVENNLLDCGFGTIHSHNNMPVFFSDTDEKELEITAQEREHYLSIVVNNNGNIIGRVTTKDFYKDSIVFLEKHSNPTIKYETIKYPYYQKCELMNAAKIM